MGKRIIPILIVIAIVAAVGYYWWQNYGGAAAANNELGGSGTIEAQQIAVTPQTSGRILMAPSEEGAAVKAGEVLYKVDSSILQLQIKSLQTVIDAAKSNYDHVRKDDNSSHADRVAAKAQWQQALLSKEMAQAQLGYYTVKSPVDGIISSIAQHVGENAAPGTTMAMLSQVQSLTVTIYVPETRIGEVKMGQQGDLTTDSTTKTYHAQVSYISSSAEFTPSSIETKDQRVKLVYQVKLDVTDADDQLKPGMPADVVLK